MGVQDQAKYSGSLLSKFLDEHLPNRTSVVEAWAETLAAARRGDDAPRGDIRNRIGWVLDLRIGLDLPETPPRLRELSYLSVGQCAALLTAAGFEPPAVGEQAERETTDPVLVRWTRTSHPVAFDEAQRTALRTCLLLDSFSKPIHRWGDKHPVDRRRTLFARAVGEDDLDRDPGMIDALSQCWEVYLDGGRQGLLALGTG